MKPHTVVDLDSLEIETTYGKTSGRDYNALMKLGNVTSNSMLETFYECPRKFQKMKEQANAGFVSEEQTNVDHAFGHAVGAGIQDYLINKDIDRALYNALLAWRMPLDTRDVRGHKSFWEVMIAVQQFINVVMFEQLDDWELLQLPSGKPAIEVAFSFHCGKFKHYAHMDIGMRNKHTKQIAVFDAKTTKLLEPQETQYANSYQGLSYAIMLETALQEEIMDYEVHYIVYSSGAREWTDLSFVHNWNEQAEWVRDLLMTQNLIETYTQLDFFPKRGKSCFNFFRPCEFYGDCNMTEPAGELPILADTNEAEEVDYVIKLSDVIEKLKSRKREI